MPAVGAEVQLNANYSQVILCLILQCISRDALKCLLHIVVLLGRGLKIGNVAL